VIEVVGKTLEEYDTPAGKNQPPTAESAAAGETNGNKGEGTTAVKEGGRGGRKRKAGGKGPVTSSAATTQGGGTVGGKRSLEAITFPMSQPTHTGYLTSATLLPCSSPL